MPLHSKIMWAVCLLVLMALAASLMGILPTVAVFLLVVVMFVRRVGWRRAIFPFTAHLHSYR